MRWRSGQVSAAQLRVPIESKGLFLAIGLVEALASLLGFLGAAHLPGVVLPLLAQSILLWQVLLAVTVLKKRLGAPQVCVCVGGRVGGQECWLWLCCTCCCELCSIVLLPIFPTAYAPSAVPSWCCFVT